MKEAVLLGARMLKEKGAAVEEFDLSLVEYAIPAYYVIARGQFKLVPIRRRKIWAAGERI